jgi:putative transcriptional regulator
MSAVVRPRPCCVYVLRDPRTDAVHYVGITFKPQQRLHAHILDGRRARGAKGAWIRELLTIGVEPLIEVIEANVADSDHAERQWIAHYRGLGAPLTNVLNGGSGATIKERGSFLRERASLRRPLPTPPSVPSKTMTPEKIRELRHRLGWTREHMAHELGVSTSTIVRWEIGATTPIRLAQQALERLDRRHRAPDANASEQ